MPAVWHAHVAASAFDDFFAMLKKKRDQTLLDLSPGYDLIPLAAARGFSVSSVDSKEEILAPAKARRRIALSQPENGFGAVLCVGTFSFLPRESAPDLAREIQRVLIPGGIAFASFSPLWASDPDDTASVRTYFDRTGISYRRDHGEFGAFVVYQTREIENLFRPMKILSLVTQTNGARRLVAMKKG
jgi:SAM-dependent methyltransferase